MIDENVRLNGWITAIVRDRNGNIKEAVEIHNLITNVGKATIAGLIGGLATNKFTYMAIGSDATAADATQTALVAEIARKAGTASQITTTVSNDTYQLEATFSSSDSLSGTASIQESGLFDAASAGNMLNRATFGAVNVNWDAGDTFTLTWKVQVQ